MRKWIRKRLASPHRGFRVWGFEQRFSANHSNVNVSLVDLRDVAHQEVVTLEANRMGKPAKHSLIDAMLLTLLPTTGAPSDFLAKGLPNLQDPGPDSLATS